MSKKKIFVSHSSADKEFVRRLVDDLKKIDLPESWVKAFLQVQSASAFPGDSLTLDSATVSEVLAILRSRKEKEGPRCLRFRLTPGEKISILVEPRGEVVTDSHIWKGEEKIISIWGRRRLFPLEELLVHSDTVELKLLGSGLPSWWSVTQNGHRFEMAISGWTRNDWSGAARFHLLAGAAGVAPELYSQSAELIEKHLVLTPEKLAELAGCNRPQATAALQSLCSHGEAMYDGSIASYRWRRMLPPELLPKDQGEDKALSYARQLIAEKKVSLSREEDGFKAIVEARNTFVTSIKLDSDGRVAQASCTCSFFRREGLRKGPCSHILATFLEASDV